jgi:hypothetical protein
MDIMNLNTNTYALASSGSSDSITLTPQDKNTTSLVSGTGAVTATIPASATVPVQGKMIAPGVTTTFTKNDKHETIAAISLTAGTGSLYVSTGAGE